MSNSIDVEYKGLLRSIIEDGERIQTRNGMRLSLTDGYQLKVDLRDGFPLVGLRYTWFKGAAIELLWMLQGLTTLDYLHKHGVHFWDKNARGKDDLGPIYGKQWRDFGGVDQIEQLEKRLSERDTGTRNVVAAWNPSEQNDMALPPCHCLFQMNISGNNLDTIVTMRSSDVVVGLCINIAFYALLAEIMAKRHGYIARKLTMQLGHTHIYKPHLGAAIKMIGVMPTKMPKLSIDGDIDCDWSDIDWRIFKIKGYVHRGRMSLEMVL